MEFVCHRHGPSRPLAYRINYASLCCAVSHAVTHAHGLVGGKIKNLRRRGALQALAAGTRQKEGRPPAEGLLEKSAAQLPL